MEDATYRHIALANRMKKEWKNDAFLETLGEHPLIDGHIDKAVAMKSWSEVGCPLVVVGLEEAHELAETDVDLMISPEIFVVGIQLGGSFIVTTPWSEGDEEDWQMCVWEWHKGSPLDMSEEEMKRLIKNVYFVLHERPEGLDVDVRRPSIKSARKNGRKYAPGIEYIIRAPAPLKRDHRDQEGSPRAEGWTWSVRSRVRGHWRRQAVGPRGAGGHKTIWIRPHWRGPEDAPVSIHPLAISA